jgi:hypothetical protein
MSWAARTEQRKDNVYRKPLRGRARQSFRSVI